MHTHQVAHKKKEMLPILNPSILFFYAENICTTPNKQPGICIDIRECSQLFSILTRPSISIDDRNFLRQSQCGYNKYPLVSEEYAPRRQLAILSSIFRSERTINWISVYSTGVLSTSSATAKTGRTYTRRPTTARPMRNTFSRSHRWRWTNGNQWIPMDGINLLHQK